MSLVQTEGGLTAQDAGLLTVGYAIAIVAFIRVGEKLLQCFGPRKPMIWGLLIVGAAIVLQMPTSVLLATYKMLAVAAFTMFVVGLAFYAIPSTYATLSNLPVPRFGHLQDGVLAGRLVRRGPLGTIFTALSGDNAPVNWIDGVITFVGRQANLAICEAALFAFGANLLMVVGAIVAIVLTVPREGCARNAARNLSRHPFG